MRIKTRETGTGTEYWDNIEKRTVFVPNGEEPGFEFKKRDEVKSMLAEKQEFTREILAVWTAPDFKSMTINQLREYADGEMIVIPEGVTKKNDIIAFLVEATSSEGTETEEE